MQKSKIVDNRGGIAQFPSHMQASQDKSVANSKQCSSKHTHRVCKRLQEHLHQHQLQ